MPMSARKQPEDNHKFQVGDRVSVTLHTGLIVEGTVRAIVERTDGVRLQVDCGRMRRRWWSCSGCMRNETVALISDWTVAGVKQAVKLALTRSITGP